MSLRNLVTAGHLPNNLFEIQGTDVDNQNVWSNMMKILTKTQEPHESISPVGELLILLCSASNYTSFWFTPYKNLSTRCEHYESKIKKVTLWAMFIVAMFMFGPQSKSLLPTKIYILEPTMNVVVKAKTWQKCWVMYPPWCLKGSSGQPSSSSQVAKIV